MNQNIFDIFQKFQKVLETADIFPSPYNTPSYDTKDDNDNFQISQECAEADYHRLLNIVNTFYSHCQNIQDYNDFVTVFAMYCNIYILRGFLFRITPEENSFFGLPKSDFQQVYDGKLLPYMEEIFTGIYHQDFSAFERAEQLIPEFSIAHLYLFVFQASHYFYVLEEYRKVPSPSPELCIELQNYRNSMWNEYYSLHQDYRQYVFLGKSYGISGVYLPHFHIMDKNTLYTTNEFWEHLAKLYCSVASGNIMGGLAVINSPETVNILESWKKVSAETLETVHTNISEWNADYFQREKDLNLLTGIYIDSIDIILFDLLETGNIFIITSQNLQQAQQAKKQVINEFSHTYSNMKATTLHDIGTALMSAEGESFRYYGRLTLREYSIKENLTKEIELLKLRFEDDIKKLLENVKNTVCSASEKHAVQIQDIISEAWKRCFMTLLYDETSKGTDWCNLFFGTKQHKASKDALRDDFEEAVLISSDRNSTVSWLERSKVIDFKFTITGIWEELYFKKDDYAALLLTDWISELFTNVIRYADRHQPVTLECTSNKDILHISLHNQKNTFIKLHNTQIGVNFISSYLQALNQSVGYTENPIIIRNTDTSYEINLSLNSAVFL